MRDRDLVRLYWPVELRPAFDALFDIDDAMADVVVRSTEPALGAIKLGWWREQLEALDSHSPPAEPRLRAVASALLGRGITGTQLADLVPGWATLLDARPDPVLIGLRGVTLFEAAATVLGSTDPLLSNAGFVYALMSSARLGYEPSPDLVIPMLTFLQDHRMARKFRPISGLTRLAARDFCHGRPFEPEATPGRALSLLRHRLTGKL